jgi:Mrp family chromosome partitioning ATPase
MTASLSILAVPASGVGEKENCRPLAAAPEPKADYDLSAQEQIRGLVQKVFVPGWPRPARQVVFSGASPEIDMTRVCMRTAQALAAAGAGRICLVETSLRSRAMEESFGGTSNDGGDNFRTAGTMRKSSHQISPNLWIVPADVFLTTPENGDSALWLRSRLGELRREFDYAVIQAPAVNGSGTTLLAHLADGLVLGLEAHRTRRLVARSIRDQLVEANVRVLGIVLTERRFPIPEALYRRL